MNSLLPVTLVFTSTQPVTLKMKQHQNKPSIHGAKTTKQPSIEEQPS
jgi:hypothetical protein